MISVTFFLFSNLLVYLQCQRVASTLINITVDDELGDPDSHSHITYNPPEAWKIGLPCSQCLDGFPPPSPSPAYSQTWHYSQYSNKSQGSYPPNASFTFFGSAVYVNCTIPSYFASTPPQMSFLINGSEVGQYTPDQDIDSNDWRYNVVVYNDILLPMAEHSLTIQINEQGGVPILLDSITCSTTEPKSKGSGEHGIPVTTVVGAVLGCLAFLLICAVLLLVYRQRRGQKPLLPHRTISSGPPSTRKWKLAFFRGPSSTATVEPFETHAQRGTTPRLNVVQSDALDSRTQSILAWQRNTLQATRSLDLAPPDMSEELSSYYEDATATESRRIRTPPPPPKRYIIRNV
ncbi:hypothetical protein GYMLUDRAFT_76944 [Collybiopsis luxurians FD-317 M1]|uniref:Uncharacterized protein n=1 Tax=Collybiopsis luxurians FD-317 M1 TaxID=944289 RepID=A0A0D0BXQ7_9AGAR|nr:hypothetical protein GYMLUDRAFT_76944 [Collybiopsis luxurians FD-317 M1]